MMRMFPENGKMVFILEPGHEYEFRGSTPLDSLIVVRPSVPQAGEVESLTVQCKG